MRKFKYVLLAILSVFVFAFSACEKEEVKTPTTPPAPTTPTPTTPTTEEDPDPEPETPEEPPEEETTQTLEKIFKATNEDIVVSSSLSDDRFSVQLEITPQFFIYNLTIEIALIVNETTTEKSLQTFQYAIADKKITCNVTLSETLQEITTIKYYTYNVVDGHYSAEEFENDWVGKSCKLSARKDCVLYTLYPACSLYDVTITIKLYIDENHTIFDKTTLSLNALSPREDFCQYVYLSESLIEQGAIITYYDIYVVGKSRQTKNGISENEPARLQEYWALFQ